MDKFFPPYKLPGETDTLLNTIESELFKSASILQNINIDTIHKCNIMQFFRGIKSTYELFLAKQESNSIWYMLNI